MSYQVLENTKSRAVFRSAVSARSDGDAVEVSPEALRLIAFFCLARRKPGSRTNDAAPVGDPGFSMGTHAMGQGAPTGDGFNLLIGKSCRFPKNPHKHFSRELSGLRILVRRMV